MVGVIGAPRWGAHDSERDRAMLKNIILPVVLGAVVLSAPAYAQNASDAAKCTTLIKQFDEGINPFHIGDNDTNQKARALRAEGGQLCGSGKPAEGAAKIREALQVWGVTPHA